MAHQGKLIKVYVDTNSTGGATATYVLVAQQDDFSIKYDVEKIDTKTKDDAGNPNDTITGKGWSGTFSGKLKAGDTAYDFLKAKWAAETKVWLKFNWNAIGATPQEGLAIIDLEEKASKDGSVEYTCNFAGQGALVTAVA